MMWVKGLSKITFVGFGAGKHYRNKQRGTKSVNAFV